MEIERVAPGEFNTKCGEVFFESHRKYTFACSLCASWFNDLETFDEHVQNVHFPNELDPKQDPSESYFDELEEYLSSSSQGGDWQDAENNVQEVETVNDDSVEIKVKHSNGSGESDADGDITPDLTPKNEVFSCSLCDSKYRHKRSCIAHAKKHHGILTERMKEKLKKETYQSESNAGGTGVDDEGSHIPLSVEFECVICGRAYRHERSLRAHVKVSHGNKVVVPLHKDIRCRYCSFKFNDRRELQAHIVSDHSGEEKYPCPQCDRSFRTANGRQIHIYTHTGERPFECPHCSKRFTVSSNLKKHIHAHLKIKKYACKFCNKLFVQSTERNIHEKRHTGEKPFQCEECGKRFIVHAHLSHHRRRHQNIRKFKCEICDKAFFSSTALNEHGVVHSAARPFKCDVCDQTFPTRKSLRQHQQIHSKEKKYVCTTCGKAFAQCAGLYSHKKSHGAVIK